MTKTTMTRGWNVSVLCLAMAAAGVLGAPGWAVAQTAADAGQGDTQRVAQASAETPAPASVQMAAQDQPPAPRASEVGHSARAWLDLQRSNAQAAPALPTLGSEAGLAYRRYMESFKGKIPDLYGSALGGGGNGNGGGSGGGASAGGLN
ncbi:Protein of unknown function [Paraburkholderia fungorum]|uniref:DUF3613 domain-containing protein n=1 Tax=Paraburkholderia fungorum TaxID=134537 RepID=A0A1H1BAN7_9BURK|nr:DUF3613 domain-containing protein [Paraburkholderia fungorum]SDQ48943.1 Protein of unknown function [Paraburkholderia fungorum]